MITCASNRIRMLAFFSSLVMFFGLVGKAQPETFAQQKTPWTVADLAWMSGSWATAPDGKVQIEEHWTKPAGDSMLGMGRTLKEGKMVFFEYLRIEARPEGIFYVAHPKARPGTDFKLTRLDGKEALFENPTHDNPKKILYRKNPDGSLIARVEGDENGKPVRRIPLLALVITSSH